VALSRGGGTHDRVADALSLAGLAAAQPFVPDLAGVLPRRRHVAVIVPIDGPSTAVVEADELQTPPAVDTMVISADVMAAAAEAVAAGLGAGQAARVGVLDGKAIPAAWWAMLEDVVQARSP
jgi:hypothetical protein